MALLSEETESCTKRIGELVARVNLLSHPAAENAAKQLLTAVLRPLQPHQRKRAVSWLLKHELLRGVFDC